MQKEMARGGEPQAMIVVAVPSSADNRARFQITPDPILPDQPQRFQISSARLDRTTASGRDRALGSNWDGKAADVDAKRLERAGVRRVQPWRVWATWGVRHRPEGRMRRVIPRGMTVEGERMNLRGSALPSLRA